MSSKASSSSSSSSKKKDGTGHWKSAVDAKSGRVYYYNSKTRETSWNKPFELGTPTEQHEMTRKKEEASSFFRDMERNINSKYTEPSSSSSSAMMDIASSPSQQYQHHHPYYHHYDDHMSVAGDVMFAGDLNVTGDHMFGAVMQPFQSASSASSSSFITRPRLLSSSNPAAPRMIRTISTIDDDLLEILKFDERMKQSNNITNKTSTSSSASLSRALSQDISSSENQNHHHRTSSPMLGYDMVRRRGSSSSYQNMMTSTTNNNNNWFSSSPLASSSMDSNSSFIIKPSSSSSSSSSSSMKPANFIVDIPKEYLKRRNSTGTIYVGTTMSVQDNEATIKCVCVVLRAHIIEAAKRNAIASRQYDIFKDPVIPSSSSSSSSSSPAHIPSLAEIKDFFMLIFSKSQLESECIIMALIYCERMIKETQGRFIIKHDNWKSILFACLVMASKVWDDLSMWNVDFSQISLSFNLQRVNALELAVLEALEYIIRVPASEYAKYYFHLRSMMARLGFHDNEPNKIAPLDIKGARRLQLATERYQEDRQTVRQVQSMRLDPAAVTSILAGRLERHVSADGFEMASRLNHNSVTVGLEQLVHAEHNDADGIAHTSNKNTPRTTPMNAHRAFGLGSGPSPRVAVTNVVGFASPR